jgi:hypothetical protein
MKKFKEYMNEQQLFQEENLILEFANISAKEHNFGVDVRLHVMQPANIKLKHAPRVKIYKKGESGSFSISLTDTPKVIGVCFLSQKELHILLKNITKYKTAFLEFWNDTDMSTNELTDLFRQIDQGFTIGETK